MNICPRKGGSYFSHLSWGTTNLKIMLLKDCVDLTVAPKSQVFSYIISNNHRRFREQIERLGMNAIERNWYRKLLSVFDLACHAANVSYFLYSGSLLGFREGRNAEHCFTYKHKHCSFTAISFGLAFAGLGYIQNIWMVVTPYQAQFIFRPKSVSKNFDYCI